ncbi:hypothetical protein PHABIO_371 [Pseudomonas phage Phabio]|uniref:N-acetyltransferase domain-containing protein n=1 Tax=Pseudomonas phage Phabio TaxID=2006668 RepID=A0A1Y0SU30_9CAUD|nr:hypothetical protein MZD05_gp371 [Pseudomonas phage Phabio]ARV77002.1 hypothetical protein PHABIO_371 [Pseudomonas phage Phabio]
MSQYPNYGLSFVVTDTVEGNRGSALTGLLYQMHEPNGQLVLDYRRLMKRKERRKTCIVTAYKGITPVGMCVCYINSAFTATYVKPEYRGKGVGSAMIRELRQYHNLANRVLTGDSGFNGWENFFARNHIMQVRTSGSTEEINAWADRGKGSLLTFLNFKKKRQYLTNTRRAQRISTKVANTASSYMAAWVKPMHEVRA